MTRDMIKVLKGCFFKKQLFTFNFSKKCKNWHFLKKQFFSFFFISPVIFKLEKRTIPQIKDWDISLGPLFINFTARMDIWWATERRKCPVFFAPDFTCLFALSKVPIKWLCSPPKVKIWQLKQGCREQVEFSVLGRKKSTYRPFFFNFLSIFW